MVKVEVKATLVLDGNPISELQGVTCLLLDGKPISELQGVTCLLLATRYKRTHPVLTPASRVGTDLSTRKGWKAELT